MLIFILVQFFTVFLSTIKSIVTIEGSRGIAAIVSAISYTFGAVIVKIISQQDFLTVVIVTFFSNLIGVYLAKLIMNKLKKEKLWTITATVRGGRVAAIENTLRSSEIQYTLVNGENDRNLFFVYARTRKETKLCKEIFAGNSKYSAVENIYV